MTAATPPALAWKVRNADRQPLQVAQARLLDRVRITIRARHYSHSTEKAYVQWIRRFVLFHGKRHPAEMGGPEVSRYLSHLATVGRVSRTIEELLGHRDVSTTMIYTHVLNRGGRGVRSPRWMSGGVVGEEAGPAGEPAAEEVA